MSNFNKAFLAAQWAYDNITPDYDDDPATDYICENARSLAAEYVAGGEIPGFDLDCESAYVKHAKTPSAFWAFDCDGNMIPGDERGTVRVDLADLPKAVAADKSLTPAAVDIVEQYICDNESIGYSIYEAWAKSMEPDYD